jgi:hypothetical protein
MKKVMKILFSIIGVVYFLIAIFAIVCLLQKNDYGYPQFGKKVLFSVEEEIPGSNYEKGDLVIISKPKNEDVKINDAVFFYDTEFSKNTLNLGNITSREVINDEETTFTVPGKSFSSEFLAGRVNDAAKYKTIGGILNVLLSRWGFFLIIIVPFFVMFMIEIFAIYTELKYGNKKNN